MLREDEIELEGFVVVAIVTCSGSVHSEIGLVHRDQAIIVLTIMSMWAG